MFDVSIMSFIYLNVNNVTLAFPIQAVVNLFSCKKWIIRKLLVENFETNMTRKTWQFRLKKCVKTKTVLQAIALESHHVIEIPVFILIEQAKNQE